MFKYLIIEITSAIIGFIVIAFLAGFIANKTYPPDFAMPAFMHSHAPGGLPPSIPFAKIIDFFRYKNRFEKIFDIGANPKFFSKKTKASDADGIVRISLTAQEVISEISPGI